MSYLLTLLLKSSLIVIFATQPSVQQSPRDKPLCDRDLPAISTFSRLRKAVFCFGYDLNVPARHGNETTEVTIDMRASSFKLDDKLDILSIYSWLRVSWYDFRLKWDPAKYDNIKKMHAASYYLWKPDIGDYTAVGTDKTSEFTLRPSLCLVYHDGQVLCVPPFVHTVPCSADLLLWPYDSQTCRLEMGSWTHGEDKIRIKKAILTGYTSNIDTNREWLWVSNETSIQTKKIPYYNESYSIAAYTFVFKRQPKSFAATVILPAIVLMLVTLVTYWMEPNEPDRLILASVDIFCHFLVLMHLGRVLPSNGYKTPHIVTFYRDSMFLATMAVFTTTIVRSLRTLSVVLPVWASALSRWMVQTRFGQVLIFHNSSSKVNTPVSGSENSASNNTLLPEWNACISMFDLFSFIITLFTYAILLIGFLP